MTSTPARTARLLTTDEADLIERIAEALSIQQRPTRAWSECSPSTQSYWRASARAVLPILADVAEALSQTPAEAVRAIRTAFYEQHPEPPMLNGARGVEVVGATHATNVCMDFLTTYADEQETTR